MTARIEGELLAIARSQPSRVALVDRGDDYSFADLLAHACAFAELLARSSVTVGDRVGVFLEKSPQSVVALYGIWLAGGVAVPIHAVAKTAQVCHVLANSGARVLVSNEKQLAGIGADLPAGIECVEVSMSGEGAATQASSAVEFVGGKEPAAILYTSGSTGLPKGIVVSHDNLLAGARIVSGYLEIRPDDRILSLLPFSFDYGLNQLLIAVRCGATLILQRSAFPADICRTLQSQAVTGMAGIPTLWLQLMQAHSPFGEQSFEALRYITNTGGVFPIELVRRYREHLPQTRIHLMYGLSEAFRSTSLDPAEIDRRPDSMGKAIAETEVFVLNSEGGECAPDEVGELVHRGPTVALGYFNDPVATDAVFREHPAAVVAGERVVYSGDLVTRDEAGFLFFVGRRDQMIKRSGFRMSPDEVETILLRCDLVREVAVAMARGDDGGEALVAHVVSVGDGPASAADASTDELLQFCRREMPIYMVPSSVKYHATLPRTANGKIDRLALDRRGSG